MERFRLKKRLSAFTLVELIVVIAILAILATIGFLALSGYSQDAKDSATKANVRSVYSAIAAESVISGNSPRYYVIHDSGAALTGAFAFVDGNQTALTGGNWNVAGTNYSAGNPDYAKLKLNAEKFKVGFLRTEPASAASFDGKYLIVGAMDSTVGTGNKARTTSYFQVAWVAPATGIATVTGNFPATQSGGSVTGLIRDSKASSQTGALMDGIVGGTAVSQTPACPNGYSSIAGSCVPSSCQAIKNAYPSSADGTYSIDPDGAGGNAAFNALCDMTTDGGGWTLVSYAGTITSNLQTTAGVATATLAKPLFFEYGTYDPSAKTTRTTFSRVRQFRPYMSETTEYLARRTSNPNNMVIFPMQNSKYGTWFGRNVSEGDFAIPTDAYLPYLKMTKTGNSGWKTVTNNVYWSYDSSWNYPGINWNDGGTPWLTTTSNIDGYGDYATGLNHRSILYWEVAWPLQWFHAQPLSLAPSTGANNGFQDFEFYVRF